MRFRTCEHAALSGMLVRIIDPLLHYDRFINRAKETPNSTELAKKFFILCKITSLTGYINIILSKPRIFVIFLRQILHRH